MSRSGRAGVAGIVALAVLVPQAGAASDPAPTAAPDPQGLFPARTIVWGVFPYRGLVLASDINSGLWVLRLRD